MFPNFNELPPLREAASERLDLESGMENGKKEICIRNLELSPTPSIRRFLN